MTETDPPSPDEPPAARRRRRILDPWSSEPRPDDLSQVHPDFFLTPGELKPEELDALPPRAPDALPVVLTAEDIVLYCTANTMHHLPAEKQRVLHASRSDTESFVMRQFQFQADRNKDVRAALSSLPFGALVSGRWSLPAGIREEYIKRPGFRRGDPTVADDRALIVQFVRQAGLDTRLDRATAERVLAEAGESLDWMDSVPDRLILHEPIVPLPGTPVEKRRLLAELNPVLAECMESQNRAMIDRLAAVDQSLAAQLREALDVARRVRVRGPAGDSSPGR